MNIFALILGIVAVVLFTIEGVRTKSLVAWGLAAISAMLIAQAIIETSAGDLIRF